eukprot:gnl/TRDRNA2_/TRDRNA2_157362_c0_seq1.p1 gnl/TRDRNA2_/TRDRNA2_157362_c0~~gnl/TRDRNA2_/TRDRNA2_157362_c0_seq1.p1  ORF type:complete len:395 (+),score=30.80 gnl/TRDRNA2_/TRDRNA2_157362_c0_seq1:119-1303(+)
MSHDGWYSPMERPQPAFLKTRCSAIGACTLLTLAITRYQALWPHSRGMYRHSFELSAATTSLVGKGWDPAIGPNSTGPNTLGELLGGIPCPTGASMTPMKLLGTELVEDEGQLIKLHEVLVMPDSNALGVSPLHRFRLDPEVATSLNDHLVRHTADEQRSQGGMGPVSSSNKLGCFHSAEQTIWPMSDEATNEASVALSHASLPEVIKEALAAVAKWHEEHPLFCPPPLEDCLVKAWYNLMPTQGSLAFNALHNHGTARWSGVYFATGADESRPFPKRLRGVSNDTDLPIAAFPGALMMRCQLVPSSTKFAYLPIKPIPGEMWLFPGFQAHAVAPIPSGTLQQHTASAAHPKESRRAKPISRAAMHPCSAYLLPSTWRASRSITRSIPARLKRS